MVSDTLSRFDLAEQRMAIETATGVNIDEFVFQHHPSEADARPSRALSSTSVTSSRGAV